MAGDFTFLHMMAIDSKGNLYAGETVGGRRVQKFEKVVKGNKVWSRSINDHKPLRVRVVGTPNGDVVVMESIR
jgi:hypothetical protein